MMACLLYRIGIHADVRYGAVSARWQGLGTWRAGLIKLSHDYCNMIGSHNIPRLHTVRKSTTVTRRSLPPRTSGRETRERSGYPFQSQKSRSWRSFSRLEVSAGSRNQAIAPNSKINCCLITSAPPTLLYSRSTIVPTSIAGSNHLRNARKPP